MRVRWIALMLGGLLPCCWASFPEERLSQDAAAPRDLTAKDRSTHDQSLSLHDLVAGDRLPLGDRSRSDINMTCDPGDPPRCEIQGLVTCSSSGKSEVTPCPLGCEGGQCCVDTDQDQSILCKESGGDCDDTDELVFPGQVDFFGDQRGNGTYDYNCDDQDEPQYSDQHNCQKSGGGCDGDGWSGAVPDCGEWGNFVWCVKDAGQCVPDNAQSRRQTCR